MKKNRKVMILAGGKGTRLWPVSRENYPKFFLKIGARGGDSGRDKKPRAGRFPVSAPGKSLLQAAVVRGVKLAGAENVFIVSNEEYRFLLRDHLKEGGMDFPLENILAEPVGKNTLAAIALGVRALEARDEKKEVAATQGEGIASAKKGRPKAAVTAEGISLNGGREVLAQGAAGADNDDASIFVFPADHLIKDEAKFIAALKKAEAAAGEEYITALGIKPYRAETGYGYIKAGGKLRCNKSRKSTPGTKVETMVEKFVEKPSEAKAEKFLKSGNYFWNAGIFVASASVFRAEFEKNSPALWRSFQKWDGKDFKKLGGFYKKLPSVSFDCAVMEKTKKAAVVVYDGRWNDLGGWDSVYEVTKKDKNGNALGGDVISLDSENNLVYSTTGKAVSLIGVKDLRIAQTDDALLIMAEGRSQEVKRVVEKLKGREELVNHIRVRRPWGSFKTLERADNYKIKVIEMLPGRSLSLQKHRRRSEEWLVLTGNVEVELNGKIHKLKENGRIKIPKGASHRLTNNCRKTAKILEIAHGSYIEEDDIIRLEDDFGRV